MIYLKPSLRYANWSHPHSNDLLEKLKQETSSFEGIHMVPGDLISSRSEGLSGKLGVRHIGMYVGCVNSMPHIAHFTMNGLRLDVLDKLWSGNPKLEHSSASLADCNVALKRLKEPLLEGKYCFFTNNCLSFVKRCLPEGTRAFEDSPDQFWTLMKQASAKVMAEKTKLK